MTTFRLAEGHELGLMPADGIHKLFRGEVDHPFDTERMNPRTEIYLQVDDLDAWILRCDTAGARVISPLAHRNWGDRVIYYADPDLNIIALAQPIAVPVDA